MWLTLSVLEKGAICRVGAVVANCGFTIVATGSTCHIHEL